MATTLTEILAEIDLLLDPTRFQDYGPNGLQVPGREEVITVATGVTASLELFDLAASNGADLVIVHHGIFWSASSPGPIDQPLRRRLKVLFDADISLAAYHLPLDAHPTIGNNALLSRILGAEPTEPFALHRGQPIGFISTFPHEGLPVAELIARVREATAREPLAFDCGPDRIRRLAVVTGAGGDYLGDAITANADVLLTGEPSERIMSQARESQIHFIAAGHYATETFGIRALGDHLAKRFGLRHVFLDIPNPV